MYRVQLQAVAFFARNVLFDDDSEEENEVHEKVDNYAEITVPLMNDNQFKKHFRMAPDTFEDLLRKAHVCLQQNNQNAVNGGHPRTPLEKEMMITIWYLGNLESFRSVGDRFGVTKSTCWDILYRTSNLLMQVNRRFKIICWPNENRQLEVAANFNTHHFPGVIGCIDGSHIRITAPRENRNSYVNRKGYHSLLLQGVCDHEMLFIDVYSGEAGSLHDENLFQRSDLSMGIRQGLFTFNDDNHLIGDLAYTLRTNLLVGFKDNGHLTVRQKNFNLILSKMRVKIENAFALLKGRFRRLKLLETVRLDLSPLLIVVACILHNVCILNGDLLEDIINIDEERGLEIENHPNNVLEDIEVQIIEENSIRKRRNLMNNLPIIINN